MGDLAIKFFIKAADPILLSIPVSLKVAALLAATLRALAISAEIYRAKV
ncbi:MAG: hypothetical protein ACI8R9_002273 [Paraglaciecola sp.]|jgi:hypothetical protein